MNKTTVWSVTALLALALLNATPMATATCNDELDERCTYPEGDDPDQQVGPLDCTA